MARRITRLEIKRRLLLPTFTRYFVFAGTINLLQYTSGYFSVVLRDQDLVRRELRITTVLISCSSFPGYYDKDKCADDDFHWQNDPYRVGGPNFGKAL
jgi:hypothetical protein